MTRDKMEKAISTLKSIHHPSIFWRKSFSLPASKSPNSIRYILCSHCIFGDWWMRVESVSKCVPAASGSVGSPWFDKRNRNGSAGRRDWGRAVEPHLGRTFSLSKDQNRGCLRVFRWGSGCGGWADPEWRSPHHPRRHGLFRVANLHKCRFSENSFFSTSSGCLCLSNEERNKLQEVRPPTVRHSVCHLIF